MDNAIAEVSICVCTYKRPQGLERLLNSLEKLTFRKCPKPVLEVIVVDNEVNERTKEICKKMHPILEVPIRYKEELKRGISYARNKALASVSEGSDFIAFIDDDEIPSPFWLDELMSVQKKYAADVVSGPMVKMFQDTVPVWLRQLFDSVNFTTGESLTEASTNNVLIRKKIVEDMKLAFDDRFALSGGGDVYFFGKMHKAGYKLVWAQDAIVYEPVSARRADLRWALLRKYRCGNVRMRINLDGNGDCRMRLRSLCHYGFSVLWNSVGLISDAFRGANPIIQRLGLIARAMGCFTALLGINYFEYTYPDGDSNGTLD